MERLSRAFFVETAAQVSDRRQQTPDRSNNACPNPEADPVRTKGISGMRILTRYLLRLHIGPFIFALTVLTSLLFINVVARRFEDLAGKGLPTSVILEVLVLSLPHILALTLPMAVLVAVLHAFSSLAQDNEITALKASGVNLVSMMVPLMFAGVLFGAGLLWFNDSVLPETNHRLKTRLIDIGRKSPVVSLKEQVINNVQTQDMTTRYYLQAAQIDPVTNKLHDVVIYDLSVPGRDRTVYADSGLMAFNSEQTDLFLQLYDGWIHELRDNDPATFQRVFFNEQLMQMKGIGNTLELSEEDQFRSDREMNLAMLAAQVDSGRAELAKIRQEATERGEAAVDEVLGPLRPGAGDVVRRTSVEMHMLQTRAEAAIDRINMNQVEYHKKFAIPFACIVFVLLGAPLAVRFPRGGIGMVIAASLSIFGIYYMCLIGGEALGDRGVVAPFWGPWAPNLLFLAISLFTLRGIGRETASTRGGGWDDLWYTLRGLLPGGSRRAA